MVFVSVFFFFEVLTWSLLASKIAVYGKVIITLTQQNILKSHFLVDEPVPYYTCYVKALKGESVCV